MFVSNINMTQIHSNSEQVIALLYTRTGQDKKEVQLSQLWPYKRSYFPLGYACTATFIHKNTLFRFISPATTQFSAILGYHYPHFTKCGCPQLTIQQYYHSWTDMIQYQCHVWLCIQDVLITNRCNVWPFWMCDVL